MEIEYTMGGLNNEALLEAIGNIDIISLDNDLVPGRHQAII